MNPLEILEGPDFQFGKGRKGNIDVLSRHFNVNVLRPVLMDESQLISSTHIRQLMQQGYYEKAEDLLGWNLLTHQYR